SEGRNEHGGKGRRVLPGRPGPGGARPLGDRGPAAGGGAGGEDLGRDPGAGGGRGEKHQVGGPARGAGRERGPVTGGPGRRAGRGGVAVDRDVELRLGASASVANLGVRGEKYVELVPGPVGAQELPEGTTLKGDVPVPFDQITKLARDIEVDVKDITKNLNQAI